MGQLLIKQKVFSIRDKFDIYEENQNVKYRVESSLFSLKYKLTVYDTYGNELGVITQKVFTLMPKYDVEINGNYIGQIKQKFTFFKPKYEVDYNGWSVEGNIMGWNYSVNKGFNLIASIKQKIISWGDTYVIDFINQEDELMILMLVLAIDATNRSQAAASSASVSS